MINEELPLTLLNLLLKEDNLAAPVTTGGGGTFDPAMDPRGRRDPTPSWHGATAARGQTFERTGGQEGQVAGPGFGRGAYWAEGGRVGYQDGELVEDEYMAEATPRRNDGRKY